MAITIEMQKKALLEIKQLFLENGIEDVAYQKQGQEQAPVDMVHILIRNYGLLSLPAAGVFYFLPSANDEMMYFSGEIEYAEDMQLAQLPEVCQAVAAINYCLPYGNYCVDVTSGTLKYRLSVPIIADITYEELMGQLNLLVAHTLEMGEKYSYLLTELGYGNIGLEDVLSALPQTEEE